MLRTIYDNRNPNSWATRARKKRFDFFLAMLEKLKKPVTILDIGGTSDFWDKMGFSPKEGFEISLLNLKHQKVNANFKSVVGSATNLSEFNDDCFDVVFSNSVIEHLFTWENQVRMAEEVRRVGKNYFIQTPNYWFPIEPHFVFPFFHYLPKSVRVSLLLNFSLGHSKKYEDKLIAKKRVDEIKLLSAKDMRRLFPDGTIYRERFLGFTKSIVSYRF